MNMVPFRNRSTGLGRLQSEMNNLFGRFFDDFSGGEYLSEWAPALDIAEREDAVVVKAELPGLSADDIDISVEGNTLSISGEKKAKAENQGENYYHVERRYGRFRRDLVLPATVDSGHIAAEHRDGVLTITLPKSEKAKPRKIEVKS